MTTLLGIDIGGTGIKGAPVDTNNGELLEPRHRILTPQPATPDAVAGVVADVAKHFGWAGPIGATFPAVVQHGVVKTAANVDKSWIGTDAAALLTKATGSDVVVLNDADAAGLAEVRFGAGRGRVGTIVVITLGTGIGSAVFVNGALVANTELGHLQVRGKDAETRAAESVRER
jgi:polyphosphate glucokinase